MRYLKFTILILSLSNVSFGQVKTNNSKNNIGTCAELMSKGYTKQFCAYDNSYSFKGIAFETNFKVVDTFIKLERYNTSSNIFTFKNKKFTDWGNTRFDDGSVCFENGTFLEVTLSLDGRFEKNGEIKKENIEKYEALLSYLSELFGSPEVIKRRFEDYDFTRWVGFNLDLVVQYGWKHGTISLSIASKKYKYSKAKTLDNL